MPPTTWDPVPPRSSPHIDALAAWLRTHGMTDDVAAYEGPDIPDDPGAMIVVTILPGAGYMLEQMLDAPAIQVRSIGGQYDPASAQDLALGVDQTFTRCTWPQTIGGRVIVNVSRSGGAPSPDRVDPAGRTHYVCTYVLEVGT